MKTRDSNKSLLADTDNTTELIQGAKQCNLSSGLTQQMNTIIIFDPASRFQVPPKTTLFYTVKKIDGIRYLLLNIISEKKIRIDQWGPNFDEMVCSKSI